MSTYFRTKSDKYWNKSYFVANYISNSNFESEVHFDNPNISYSDQPAILAMALEISPITLPLSCRSSLARELDKLKQIIG